MKENILEMEQISKSFGGIHALKNVHFHVLEGEVHVLAGENGAGKSTLLKMLVGINRPDFGEIRFGGESVKIVTPSDAEKLGIGMVFQELTLINELTVLENVYMCMEYKKCGMLDKKKMRTELKELMERYHIQIDPDAIVAKLSIAQKQMVEILKLLVKNPKLLILDEPTSSLASKEVETLFDIIKSLTANGKTVIFISHRMEEIFAIGDRITIFKDGEFVAEREVADLTENDLIKLQVGRTLDRVFPEKAGEVNGTEAVFGVKGLSWGKRLKDISFEVRKGEVLGIAGLQGQGQSDLLNTISGINRASAGEMHLNGKQLRIKNSSEAVKEGIALVPSDRKTEGLILSLSVLQNMAIASLHKRQKLGFIKKAEEKKFVNKSIKDLSIKVGAAELPVNSLSGGNQQKVVLGKELGIRPKVLLFDEPTKGIDVEANSDFYKIIRELADEGVAVIVNSSDMMEVIGISDRVMVMYEGKVQGFLTGEAINEETIMAYSMGMTDAGKEEKTDAGKENEKQIFE